jgi:predicted acylesterase/phospholipase RssA
MGFTTGDMRSERSGGLHSLAPGAFSKGEEAERRPRPYGLLAIFFMFTVFAGCTHVNQRLDDPGVPLESRRKNQTRSAGLSRMPSLADADGCFIGIAISGGGLRSANFGAACLFQLQRVGLLQKADYLSAVSGGALPAAYYCLGNESQWNPGNVQQRLTHRYASEIIFTAILPWNAAVLLLTPWDSTDVLADTLDRHLFRRDGRSLTFADLRPDRPRLLINATDLQSGRRFVFSNESFDELNTDLSKYPIAHAVAASSAFPVVLQAKTLRDYSTIYKQYRHLIDGGVSDNLGVQSLIDVYDKQSSAAAEDRPEPYPRGAVIVIIDADTRYDARLSDKADIGMLEKMRHGMGLSSTALLAKANSATLTDFLLASGNLTADQIGQQRRLLEEKGHIQILDRHGRPIRLVYLSLRRLRLLNDLPFPSFNETIENIGTYYDIKKTEAYRLYQAADLLVRDEDMSRTLEGIMRELQEASR